jgi:thiol-disulfide isomerase/thioredoxin
VKRLRRSGPTAHRQVEQIDPGFAPRLAADVGVVYLDNQAVLFDGRTGDTHLLNPSGAIIVSSYDGVTTLQAIITDIAAEVGVSEQVIGDDVLAVTRGLGAAGVLDGVLGAPRVAPGTGLEPNTPLPQFAAVTDSGDQIDAWQPAAGVRTLLVNWSLSCGFCAVIAPALGQLSEGDDIDVVLVTKAAPSDVAVQLSSFGVGEVPVLSVSDLPLFFRGVGTPAAYLVSPDGRVESPIAVGANSVGPLIDELLS